MAKETSGQTIADKQYLAKILYTTEKLEQKVIAKKIGVSEKTISKWVNDFGWKKLRNRLLVGKEQILSDMYEEMEELQAAIKAKAQGERFSNNSQADIKVKLTASIRNLETDLAISDIVESGIRFVKFLQVKGTYEQVLEFSELWHQFILENAKTLK